MMLDFPLDFVNFHNVNQAMSTFGELDYWYDTDPLKGTVLARFGPVDPQDIYDNENVSQFGNGQQGQWENEGQDENIPPVPDLNGDHQTSISSVTSGSGGTDTAMFKSVGALVPIISASHEIPNITFKVLSESFPLYIGLRRSPRFNPHRDGHKSMEVKIDPKLGIGKPRGQSVKKLKQMAYQFGVLFAEGPIAEEDFAPENQDQPDSVPADYLISSSEDWAGNVWSYSPTPEEVAGEELEKIKSYVKEIKLLE
uniref:Uncharacterized protein n=1 Tax=Oryza glumipatula TaxID=40148 RepID=A0A0D9ZHK5_9ORYZ